MSNAKEALVSDVRFILDECARLHTIVQREGLNAIPREEFLFSLPHPNGVGHLPCGRAAALKLTALAEEVARRGDVTKRVELGTLKAELGKLIVSRFLAERRPLDIKQMDRLIQSAIKAVQRHCVTRTHFVPCHLMSTNDPERLVMGPVTFHNRTSFRKLLLGKARNRDDNNPARGNAHDRSLLARAIRYYRNFKWVAEVEIANCDASTSTTLAEEAVTAALDCLHMLLGVQWTGRMRVGGAGIPNDRKAKLMLTHSGELEPSMSIAWFGEVAFPDGWSTILVSPDFRHLQSLCAVALEAAVDPDLERPLSRRFLDAAQWFGEASRDSSPATRTVKFVTAIERMVMTEERDDITSVVAERVAALCFDAEKSREAWREKAKEAYNLRSRLVHGSISPRAPKLRRGAGIAAEVAEATLRRALEAFGIDGLRAESLKSERLARWFQELLQWAEKAEVAGFVEGTQGSR
ncbi:HEPN domain-containing protein [Cupriavidus sp. AcVe19-1a]|uniref:HEPN domain-containing protein n=1 Tax=Cupriavidus sp. AcVe19-1a TaxID=2821359 RepID=UPI001AEB161D|nr:HEPN domain-containing protein [Cupriavidus sp. AcVe19-1a]MBP0629981.1 hypothetical protein [Cupriavidus sp. AcVe19-1a]